MPFAYSPSAAGDCSPHPGIAVNPGHIRCQVRLKLLIERFHLLLRHIGVRPYRIDRSIIHDRSPQRPLRRLLVEKFDIAVNVAHIVHPKVDQHSGSRADHRVGALHAFFLKPVQPFPALRDPHVRILSNRFFHLHETGIPDKYHGRSRDDLAGPGQGSLSVRLRLFQSCGHSRQIRAVHISAHSTIVDHLPAGRI